MQHDSSSVNCFRIFYLKKLGLYLAYSLAVEMASRGTSAVPIVSAHHRSLFPSAPLKLRPYGAKQICLLLLLLLLLLFDTGTQFPGNEKNYALQYKKYKNQAGMNLTPPASQNSYLFFTAGSKDPRG